MARTALIAGTAQSVAGRVAARQPPGMAKKAAAEGTTTTPGTLTDEVVDQLMKLAALHDAGVLTEEEFAAKKTKLLP